MTGAPTTRDSNRGFTLVEILIAIALVGVLAAVVVLGVGKLTGNGAAAACATSRDAATSGSNVYFTGSARYPTTLLEMTSSGAGSLQLSSNVTINAAGTGATGQGWTLTMTPGVNGAAPTFDCTIGSVATTSTSTTTTTTTTTTTAPTTPTTTTTPATTTTTAPATTTTAPANGTSACPGTYAGWVGEYYANQFLTGPPSFCRDDPSLVFNWGSNGPGNGLPIWRFSARWTRTVAMTAGSHTFTLLSDDGSRLYVDGVLIIDWWTNHTPTTRTATISLSAGNHVVVLEYYQFYGPAQVSLTWT